MNLNFEATSWSHYQSSDDWHTMEGGNTQVDYLHSWSLFTEVQLQSGVWWANGMGL